MPQNETHGIVYTATGTKYVEEATASAASVKKSNKSMPITVFSDRQIKSKFIDNVVIIKNPHRRSRIEVLTEAPYDRVLALDTDTYVVDDILEIFSLLDRFDIAMAHAHKRARHANKYLSHKIPYSFPQMNGGVVLYRNDWKIRELFKEWQKRYAAESAFTHPTKKKDQTSLRELIWASDLRLAILPPEYNIRYPKQIAGWLSTEAKPKIIHTRDGVGAYKRHMKIRKIFIDCGANTGDVLRREISEHPKWEFYAFEPNPKCVKRLNDIKGITLYPKAVSTSNGHTKFYLSTKWSKHFMGSSTIRSDKTSNVKASHFIKVPTMDISDWVMQMFDKSDYIKMKMDIEGAEYDVLPKMIDDGSIDYVDVLEIEFHADRLKGISKKNHVDLVRRLEKIFKRGGNKGDKVIFKK